VSAQPVFSGFSPVRVSRGGRSPRNRRVFATRCRGVDRCIPGGRGRSISA